MSWHFEDRGGGRMAFVPETRNVKARLSRRIEVIRRELLEDKKVLREQAGKYFDEKRFEDSKQKTFVGEMLVCLALRGPGAGYLTEKQWSALAGCVAFIQVQDEESKKS